MNNVEKCTLVLGAIGIIVTTVGLWMSNSNLKDEIQDKRNFHQYEIESKMKIEAINSALNLMDEVVTGYCSNKIKKPNMVNSRSVLNKLYFTDKDGSLVEHFSNVLSYSDQKDKIKQKQYILENYNSFRNEARSQLGLDKITYKNRVIKPTQGPLNNNSCGDTNVACTVLSNRENLLKNQTPVSCNGGNCAIIDNEESQSVYNYSNLNNSEPNSENLIVCLEDFYGIN